MSEFSHRSKLKILKDSNTRSQNNGSVISGSGYNINETHNYTVDIPQLIRQQSYGSVHSFMGKSRSLRAAQASEAKKRTTIQQEAQDMMIRDKISRPWFGEGKKPFIFGIFCFLIAIILVTLGFTIITYAYFGNIFLPMDKEEFIGPAIVIIGFLSFCLAIKFIHDSFKYSEKSRKLIRFKVTDKRTVKMTKKPIQSKTMETLVSGTISEDCLTRKFDQY